MSPGHPRREVCTLVWPPPAHWPSSPELKKEPWSVYVLDQSASDHKFSGNGTITSVLEEDEPVPVVGRVKKKFRKELLEIELRLVRVRSPSSTI